MNKIDEAMKESSILIKCAKTHEELNQIAYKYWGTKNAPIKGIKNTIIMAYMVTERRKQIESEMDNN